MASIRKLLLLSAFVASAVAGPVSQRTQCARYCTVESDFSLKPGSTYTYDYETTTVTTVQGTSQDKTQLQMTAQADIEVMSKCELSLRLRGVNLKLSDPESPDYLVSIRGAREFAKAIERHTLRFSYQNGQVEHVCPSENVPTWITNIHKGVLSAFQTYTVKPEWTTRTVETDVLGKCTAEYRSLGTSWQGTQTVRKMKDLSSCSERENVETYLQGTPYSADFQTRSLPVVTGNQECEQVIGENFLQTSNCNEKLVFRPFSNHRGNGVVTTVSQKLIHALTSQRRFTGNDYRPTTETLLYSHAKLETSSAKVEEEAENALRKLCLASKDDISIEVPAKFSSMVYKLKKLSLRSLKTFNQKIDTICPENTKARKFFMDAIPLVSTLDSARFMYEMITKKSISESESNFWLTSLSFITETTPEIILTFTPLLDGRLDQAILGVSALIRNYCQGKDCSNVPEVQTAINKLAENLGENCFSPEDKKVILSLKAIGNIGYLFDKASLIEACYKNPQIRTEARLAAIETFRRASCELSREDLMNTYSNYNEDTEIRIAAYLGVMKCPSIPKVQAIKDVMMQEKINHVGSFIWTHLNALSKTKHPERQEIRDIVSNLYLMNKYASDARKFSTAHEANLFLESIDSGIHLDSHLIFSTDSYLPRTAMFNLTVDVFGKSCNLLQLDGRLEGFERVVEKFFGPGGYFPQKSVAKILREKRSLDNNKLNEIDNQYKAHFQNPDPYGSVDVKVFGTSMWYNQFKLNEDGAPDINLLDLVTRLAEQNEMEYTKSFMFLDTTFTIPMTSGLPLKIALNGTASVGLKIGGKFDVKSLQHVDVLGHIEPSGAISISSLLTVDAGNVARSGMRVISTMHSSSVLDGKVFMRNGEVVKTQLNMPRDRIDVFNMKSQLYLVHGMEEREKKVENNDGTRLQSCTGNTMSKIFGVQFCSELELPPYRPNTILSPLNGPSRLNIYIEKTDPSLKSYNFDAQWKTEVKNDNFIKHGLFSINTPDSKVDRDIKMELYLNQADHTATLKVKTPLKRLGVNAKLVDTDSQKKLDFGVTIDDKDYFSLQSEVGIEAEANAVSYASSLEVKILSKRMMAVTGSAELRHNQKYTAQLQIEDLTQKPILAKGNLEMGKRDRYEVEMSLSSFPLDGTIKGYAQLGESMSSRISADYRILEGKMNKLSVVGKMRNLSVNALTKYTGLLNVQASVLPEWNTELSFETMRTTGHIENTVSLSLGDGARSRVHTIKVQKIIKYEGSLANNKVDGSISLVYPEKNINYALSVKHENTRESLKNAIQLRYGNNKQVNSDVHLKMITGNLMSLAGDVKLSYPGREASLQAELSQSSNKEYRGTLACQWQTGRRVGVVVHYKDKCEGSRWKYEIDGNVNLPGSNPITYGTIVGYHQGQFAGSAELSTGVDKYRVKADYTAGTGLNHRMVGQLMVKNEIYSMDAAINNVKDKVNGNFDLKMHQLRRVTAKFEGRIGGALKFGSFETYWDADRDNSKRFLFSGEMRNHNDGYDGKINMQVRHRTVKGSLRTSLQGMLFSSQWKTDNRLELEWSPTEKFSTVVSSSVLLDRSRQQLGSHIEVTTPYYGFENVTLSLTHLFTNQQWSSELSTLLPRGNDVTLSSSGKYYFVRGAYSVETTAKVLTSYRGFEETYVKIKHEHTSRELTNKAEVKWGMDKRIVYEVTGIHQPATLLKGFVKVSTPFSYLKEASGEIDHTFSSDNFKTRGEVQWGPSKKISFNSAANHEMSGRRRICTVNFVAISSFRGYENTGMKFTYSNDGVTVNTDTEVIWKRQKFTSSLSASRRSQLYNKNLEGKFSLSTPFRNYESTQVSASFEMDPSSYKMNVDAQLPHRSTTSFNSQGQIISWNDIEINAVVIGNFPRYMDAQRVSIDLVHKLQGLKLRSTLDAAYGNDRLTVLLIGLTESGYNSRNSEFSATINTPLRGYEELKADFAHNQRGHEYMTSLQMNKNKLSGSFIHKLSIRDALNFETTLEILPTSSISHGKLSIVQASNGRQFEHSSYVSWKNDNKIHLNVQFMDKTFLKEFLVKVTTPVKNYEITEMKASMERQNGQHKGFVSLTWNMMKKMTLGVNVENYRWETLRAQTEFTSHFKGYEYFSLETNYDLTAPQKVAEVSILWDQRNRKSINTKLTFLYSNRLTSLEGDMTTPFAGFQRVTASVKLENRPPEKNLFVSYDRDGQKISFFGKSLFRSRSGEVSMAFSSPYMSVNEINGLVKYIRKNHGLQGEMSATWNKGNNYKAVAEYEMRDTSLKGNIEVHTPVEDYEKLSIRGRGSYSGTKLDSEINLEFGKGQTIVCRTEIINIKNKPDLSLEIESSLESFKGLSFKSKNNIYSRSFESDTKVTFNQKHTYQASLKGKLGGSHYAEMQMNLNAPVAPFRNVQLIASVDADPELYQLMSTLKWEDKESDVHLLLVMKRDGYYEAMAKLNKVFNFNVSLRNDKNHFIDGRVKLETPFEVLRDFNGYGEFKTDDSGHFVNLKAESGRKNVNIVGKLNNSQFRPFVASLEVEAPFTQYRKLTTKVEVNVRTWDNADAKLSVESAQSSHHFELMSLRDDVKFNFEAKAESSAFSSKKAIASIKTDYSDNKRITTEASVEVLGKVHYLTGQYKSNGRTVEGQMKLESPLLPEKSAEVTGKLSRRSGGSFILQSEIHLIVPSFNHHVTAKYENTGPQKTATMKINSDFLSFSTIESQLKYINANGRDVEVTALVSTPRSTHKVTGSLKNYDGEKFAELKIECPARQYLNPFTIACTLKHEGYSSMDASLLVSTPEKEARIAGNMKTEGWKNIEGFFTINTPFKSLEMFRLDGQFQNDQNKNINFQIETSNANLPSLGMTSKLSRTKGSEEVSLMLRLPVHDYRSVQLLGNLHYNSDYSSADSRVTFTLPRDKYVVYGQYGVNQSRVSGRGELEVNSLKWIATGRLEHSPEKKDVALSFVNSRSQTYTVGGAYGTSGNTRHLAATYNSPSNERYTWNSTMSHESIANFGLDVQVETPYTNYRNIQGSLQQQRSPQSVSCNAECSLNGRRGMFKLVHRLQRDGLKGSVELSAPHPKLRNLKLNYSRVKKYSNIEDSMELSYNREKQLKMEVAVFGEKSSHIVLDVPVLPLTVTADSKQLSHGRELIFRSNYLTRVVSFRTSHQCEDRQILHDAAFSWDERAEKRISYDVKLSNTDSGKELWTRLDTPIRSLMLKGNFTRTSRTQSGGINFYWDASRSLEKHVAVGFEHADISSDTKTSHKFQINMEHPKLPKEIVQTNFITYSPNEFHLKSELVYSRERHHNLFLELRADDVSRSGREGHYKTEFTLRHPATKTDVRGTAEVMNTKLESLAYLKLNTLDRLQSQNVREVRAKIMKLRQEIELMMRSNEFQTTASSKVNGRNGEYEATFEKKSNNEKDLTANIKFSKRNKALDISVMNTENTGLLVSAAFPKESASIKIVHSTNGNQVTDGHLFLGLEQSRVLKSRINWRPRLMEDLRITTGEALRSFVRSTKTNYASLSSSFSEEWSARMALMSRAATDLFSPFAEDLKNGVWGIEHDLQVAKDAFNGMYRRNEFCMRDIVTEIDHVKKVAREVANGLALGCEVLFNITVEALDDAFFTVYYGCLDVAAHLHWKVERVLAGVRSYMKMVYSRIISKLYRTVESVCIRLEQWADRSMQKLDKWVRSYAPCIIDGYYYTKHAADKIRYSINGLTSAVSDCFLSNPYYTALKNYATSIMITFKAFMDYEYVESAQAFLSRVYDMQVMETIYNHPTVDYMSDMANSALKKSVEVYHNLGMDVIMSSASESATNYLRTVALNSAQEYLSEIYQSKAGAKYEFAPERGYITMEISLPAPRNSLMEAFDLKSYPEYKKMIDINSLAVDYYEDFCIWDFYYKFTKYLTPSYWLPAFSSHALMSGNQHFITFDKLSYDFAGKCSYLLARDFVDGNFTAIVNYGTEDHMRRSLTLLVDGKRVDIGNDYKITLDNNRAELPIQIGKTVVIREGSNIRVENEKKGFSVVCNFVHNYCSVSLSGFYFGKTAGLFGTFNYEPSLDMMTPNRYVMGDVESFAKAWDVGQTVCSSSENFATLPANDYRVQERCKSLFAKSESQFRSCFKQVDPEIYMNMCITDLSAAHEDDRDGAICTSAAAYFVECKAEGVPLKMPKQCVRCEKQDGTYMMEGEAIQFPRDGAVTSADVVFLVEEKECNRDRVRYLSKLAQTIEDNFRQKGLRDVRYSVVGFGGDEIHADPHVHTMDGLESGPVRSLESAFQSLEFGNGPVNILEAIRFAASLTYRPGTTKSFILVKCSTCKSEEVKAEYSEMVRTLQDGDITLHLLMEQKYEMKSANKNSKARRVIGVDKKFAYTLKDVKDSRLSGDGDLLAQLRIPKDVCIPLAFEVNGSSFDSHFLTDTKKNTNKKFVDVLARLVVRSSSSVDSSGWGMCCECLSTEDGVGKSTCQRCVSDEMVQMIMADSGSKNLFSSSRVRQPKERRHA